MVYRHLYAYKSSCRREIKVENHWFKRYIRHINCHLPVKSKYMRSVFGFMSINIIMMSHIPSHTLYDY